MKKFEMNVRRLALCFPSPFIPVERGGWMQTIDLRIGG
jgi:hypothetical protein